MPDEEPNSDPHKFSFDLDLAIHNQLIQKLEDSPALALTKSVGPKQSGIYALYWKKRLVYVGKATKELTKSKRDLRMRLNEHFGKISGRRNITSADVRVRYLTFESEWWVFAAEYALIAHYKPEWNNSGFGSKVPGRGRPGTKRVSTWNEQFPVIDPTKLKEEKQNEPDDDDLDTE
jgi:Eco29kI restriction endonuclease